MLLSMTGFGKATATISNKKVTVEIKSLNSKNLDLFVRIPSQYRQKEIALRKKLEQSLDRGKVECNISIEQLGSEMGQQLNKTLISAYYQQLKDIGKDLEIPVENILPTLIKMPDVFTSEVEELDEAEWDGIMAVVDEAAEGLLQFRAEEGRKLSDEFTLRIENIRTAFEAIPTYESARIDAIKERIEQNLEEFVGLSKIDKNRFEQELIYYLEKFDISEEKHRLENHLNYFISTLDEPQSQGKKLGFISQEIGREINTLGSKSYHAEMQKLVVGMKDELEKIKEQILNTL